MGSLKKQSKTEQHEIVECPACKTRFAIETHIIAAHEVPRFHCSRCDNIFEREPQPVFERDKPELVTGVDDAEPEAPGPAAAEIDEDEALQEERAGDLFPAPAAASSPGLQIPRFFEGRFSTSAPQESVAMAEMPSAQLELSLGRSAAPLHQRGSADESQPDEPALHADSRDPYVLPELDLDEPEGSLLSRMLSRLPGMPALELPAMSGLTIILSPVMIFFVGLLGFSYYCQTNPAAAIEFSTKILPSAPSIPPAGLHVQRSRFRTMILDNGESVPILSGSIVNNSDRAVRDVLLEGLLFDTAGRPASNVRVMLGSDLSKTRLKALSLDMIEQLQNGEGARQIELKPGKEADFTLAFTKADPKDASYFAARIYSVR